jgi:hypothetical protein
MPLTTKVTAAAGDSVESPFVGPVDHSDTVRLDVSVLSSDEIDENGYMKPGVPLLQTGVLVSAPAQVIYGVVIEPVKVADGNAAGDISGATDIDVAVATICQVNRAIIEDNLGRVLSADELSAFGANDAIILIA